METKESLIHSTSRLVRTKGYSATGLSEILKDAGVPKGSLYHHFPEGKDQLMAEALHHAAMEMSDVYKMAMKGQGTAEKGLSAVVDVLRKDLVASDYVRGCPLATVSLEVASQNTTLREACASMFTFWIDVLESYLKYKKVDNSRSKAERFMIMLEGALMLGKVQRTDRYLIQVKEQLPQLLG